MGKTEDFDRNRPLLFSITYRMLGSVADTEDVLQEAYLRWRRTDDEVRSPRAYLSSIVTRLSIDHLRSARVRREQYVGSWLPEPLLTEGEGADAPAEAVVLEESLSMAFLVLLESLSPTERAVFLLHEVFDYDYAEVSRLVGKSEDNCRQISRRARQSLAARRPRFEASPEQEEKLMGSFLQACASGDMDALVSLLSEDVVIWSDGGGKTRAALHPIYGADKAVRYFMSILGKLPPSLTMRRTSVNGRPGVVGYFADGSPQSVLTLETGEGLIQAIHLVVNPEKLANIPPLREEG